MFDPAAASVAGNVNQQPDDIASEKGYDDDDYDYDPEITLRSIEDSGKRSMTINFSISANYTKWKPREAFRELVQNWRDAIIRSFDLAEKDFVVVREEKSSGRSTDIVYKVFRIAADDETKEWLGYIRYKAQDNEGTIEFTNRCATIEPWHLDLGGTSKEGDSQQAGAHGEGLKIALIVLMRSRQNHNVQCRSGGFNWKFNFTTRGRLVARLRCMSEEAISKAKDRAQRLSQRSLLPFAVDPRRDVQFVIGDRSTGRDNWGNKVKRNAVKREDFDSWTKAALFLLDGGDGAIIATEKGDLLTSSQLQGNIYLKGLLLQESIDGRSASITNHPLKFGYNFASGYTNRERQSVTNADEESRAILAIWANVLAIKPEMVKDLHSLLNNAEQYADVSGAQKHLKFEMAQQLRTYLIGEEFAGKWYYCAEDKNKNSRLDYIIQGLGCEGVELTNTYWKIMRHHSLLRTAEEEEYTRFTSAPPAVVPDTAFATSVCRLLRACVRACPQTEHMAVKFVQAGQLNLQVFIVQEEEDKLLLIHDRCLSVDGAVSELGLPDDLVEADIIFHTVKRLFADALDQLPLDAFEESNERTTDWRRKLEISRAEQRLLDYLRLGQISFDNFILAGSDQFRGEAPIHAPWVREPKTEVQCHRASRCFHLREKLLVADDAHREKMDCITRLGEGESQQEYREVSQSPTCQLYRYEDRIGVLNITGLEESEKYFLVLVKPTDPKSFIGLSDVGAMPPRARSPSPNALPHPVGDDGVDIHSTRNALDDPVTTRQCMSAHAPGDSSKHNNDSNQNGAAPPVTEPMVIDEGSSAAQAVSPAHRRTAISAPTQARAAASNGTFVIGARLQSLDILNISKNRWYEANSSDNVRAVIGIMRGQKYLSEENRKRQRVEIDDEDKEDRYSGTITFRYA